MLTVGLPRSGKTSWAKAMHQKYGYAVVNPDAIRMALGCYPFVASRESEVWHHVKVQVDSLFAFGHSHVILDSPCMRSVYRQQWETTGRFIRLILFDADVETCLKRAEDSNQDYLFKVIEKMAANAEWPQAGTYSNPEEFL
jgi:predicted kinase